MKWITAHAGQLQLKQTAEKSETPEEWNLFAGDEMQAQGAVHELLFDPRSDDPAPFLPSLLCAKRILDARKEFGSLMWCDPDRMLYPPAIREAGISLGQVCMVHPKPAEMVWTVAECLRCPGVVVLAVLPPRMSRAEVRRLQLAAEHGGSTAMLLRTTGRSSTSSDIYAADTRWRVFPSPGDRDTQRWKLQLIHGHGRQVGQFFLLECLRASPATFAFKPIPLPLSPALADHTSGAPLARIRA